MAFRFGLSGLDDFAAAYVVGSSNSQHSAVGTYNHLPSKSTQGSSSGGRVDSEIWAQAVEYSSIRIRLSSVV